MKNRRDFIKLSAGLGAVALAQGFMGCGDTTNAESSTNTIGEANMEHILNQTLTLHNGVKIPKLGLGLWRIENAKAPQAIESALSVGYRHIDTAQAYENEQGSGEAVRNALKNGLKREEIFVTSKVRAEHKSYESASESIDSSLKALGLDVIDLMLIHAPQPWNDFRGGDYFEGNIAAYRALEDAHKAGKLRAIGVSNFLQKDLQNIFDNCATKPMVNQVLAHIGNTPFELIAFCKAQNIVVEAYSPIAHGELLKDTRLQDMAKKYNISVPQLCIAYVLELGLVALPKSANPKHIAENAKIDFQIAQSDMEVLKNLTFKDYGEHSYFPVFSGK